MCKSCAYSVSFFRDILCLCCVREISFNLLTLKDEYLESKTRYQEIESDLKVYIQMKSVFLSSSVFVSTQTSALIIPHILLDLIQ